MKKILASIVVSAFVVSSAFAVPFAPTPLKISAAKYVQYDFNGKNLVIPVTLTGTGASASFLVYTKGKAATIGNITNGYLGWHNVNKIDTCVYVSPFTQLDKGAGTIVWNGKDKDGKQVTAGEYTYYIFGFDNMTPRIQMTQAISFNPWVFRTIITHNASGAPLANPIWFTGGGNRSAAADPVTHVQQKWVVGGDPTDLTLKETCSNPGYCDVGGLAFLPDLKFYFHDSLKESGTKITQKFEWVPNGAGILQTDWADNGLFTYTGAWPAGWNFGPGCVSDNAGNLFVVNADISGAGTESQLIYVDITDGSELKRFDLSPWWVDILEGGSEGKGQYTGGPTEINIRNGNMFLGSHSTCVNQMLDPYAADEDIVKWTNTNGDYTGDHNFEEGSEKPWVCNDYNVAPYKYSMSAEANNFSVFSSFGVGAVSFGLYAPDGFGMSYQALYGETAAQKYGVEFIDYGSPFDGIYTTNNAGNSVDATIWYAAHNSITGVISTQVAVSDAAPAAFAVAQNSPNPFNPTTTISFTLAKAGKTTVDVYNVAGQKIDTLVNSSLSAGSHSVVWNASKFSAGVYFYTVKSGDLSKTIKMTLLK